MSHVAAGMQLDFQIWLLLRDCREAAGDDMFTPEYD